MSMSPSLSWLLTWVRCQLETLERARLRGDLSADQRVTYEELCAQERQLLGFS